MSEQPSHPDLVGLLRAELTNQEVAAAGEHLEHCDACRNELAGLAVGHALLSSAARRLAPPAGAGGGARRGVDRAGAPPELPEPPALRQAPVGRARSRRGPVVVAAAAAVLLVAGVLAVLHPWTSREPAAPVARPAVRTAALLPVAGSGTGSVEMRQDHGEVAMRVVTHGLPPAPSGRFYYLWLLDPATQKMLPVGVMGARGSASFELPESLLAHYQAVDISIEKDDGDPDHAVRSVLRGRYA